MKKNSTLQVLGTEAIDNILDHYQLLWFHYIFEKEDSGFAAFFSEVDFSKLSDLKSKKILTLLEDKTVQTALVDYFASTAIEFIFEHYQFLQLNEQDEFSLKKIYVDLFNRLKIVLYENQSIQNFEKIWEELLKGHFNDLKDFIQKSFAKNNGGRTKENINVSSTICYEYSPDLQLKILNIDLAELVEPVLDIGCGKSGKLVKYLNEKGLKTIGVDRIIGNSEMFVKSEWLKYPLKNEFWGTIISHMSFSNHFIFHHLYKYGAPEKYAQKYMDILASLKIGGSFYYSPGLPFIETYLPPSKYLLKKFKVETPGKNLSKMHELLDEDVFYSCQVQKIDF